MPATSLTECRIETKYGPVFITPTGANHVHVDASRHACSGPDPHFLVVNRVETTVSAHLYRWSDNLWHLGAEDAEPYARYQSLHATRRNWTRVSDMDASRSARDKIVAELVEVVNAWAVENPDALSDAGDVEHVRNVADLERAIADKTAELDALRAELDALTERAA